MTRRTAGSLSTFMPNDPASAFCLSSKLSVLVLDPSDDPASDGRHAGERGDLVVQKVGGVERPPWGSSDWEQPREPCVQQGIDGDGRVPDAPERKAIRVEDAGIDRERVRIPTANLGGPPAKLIFVANGRGRAMLRRVGRKGVTRAGARCIWEHVP